jgi:O-antigen/teichoic acid export membrane protein
VLAQVGLPAVVLRFTAKYDALGQPGRIRRLLALGWGLTLVLSALLLLLEAWVAPRLLPRIYHTPPAASSVLLATGVFIAVALRGVTYAGFDGLRRMSYPAALENLNVAAITLVIILLRHRLGITFLLTLSLVRAAVSPSPLCSSSVVGKAARTPRRSSEISFWWARRSTA